MRRSTLPRHDRATFCLIAAGVAFGLVATLTACGGEPDKKSDPAPTPSASPTVSQTPTPSPTPESPFEDRAEVVAARKWAAAIATDMNSGKKNLPQTKMLTTANGWGSSQRAAEEDGGRLHYPGPVPFTPLKVTRAANESSVLVCLQSAGWGQIKSTGKPEKVKRVVPHTLVFKRDSAGGAWKLDGFFKAVNDPACKKGIVKGVAW